MPHARIPSVVVLAGVILAVIGAMVAELPRPAHAAPPSRPADDRPALAFDPLVPDFGIMQPEVVSRTSVRVTNVLNEPIVFQRIIGSGPFALRPPKSELQPGEWFDLPLSVKPGPRQGVHLNKRFTFQIKDHEPVVLKVIGFVPEYVSIQPDLLVATPEEPDSGLVTFRSNDCVPFRLLEVKPPVVRELDPEPGLAHNVQVDWGEWEKEGSPIRIWFTTDHPRSPQLVVMVKRPLRRPPDAADGGSDHPVNASTTALIAAARDGVVERLAELIANGVDVNAVDRSNGRSALHWAAKAGHADAVALLLKAGADIKKRDRSDRDALAAAAAGGHVEAVKALLAAGAVVDRRDQSGMTPLHMAAAFGNAATVALLIDAGANVAAADFNGLTPLMWAAGIGDAKGVELLLQAKADLNATDLIWGDDALIRAARAGNTESVAALLAAGADVNRVNQIGSTALHAAAANARVDVVRLLVKAKASLTATDAHGQTAIECARSRTDPDRDAVVAYLESVRSDS
ncbi:MAG: ankyrin repeat domain-containing protein [Phycisphaerales bacterium]|nr:ankyrin repeat domain-containing protein [Phycisphaerales bacterium]